MKILNKMKFFYAHCFDNFAVRHLISLSVQIKFACVILTVFIDIFLLIKVS